MMARGWSTLILLFLFLLSCIHLSWSKSDGLLVITVATEETDGFKRFMRSANIYGHQVKVLGMGDAWQGGNVKVYPGGGQKVNLLRKELEKYKDKKDKVVMFTDSYDVLFTAGPKEILEQFDMFHSKVVFSAEGFCWPDDTLKDEYPPAGNGKRYLNSGAFMGYASHLYDIVATTSIKNGEDDQLFFTKIYLNDFLRKKHQIRLDRTSKIFQNLNGAQTEVELRFLGKEPYLQNTEYSTVPLVIHGNGASKLLLNTLGNYLARSYSPSEGCIECLENTIDLNSIKEEHYPIVLMGIYIEQPTPFFEEFLQKVSLLTYPKNKIHLYVHMRHEYNSNQMQQFLDEVGSQYASVKYIKSDEKLKEWHARDEALAHCLEKDCDYYFNLDSTAHMDDPYFLNLLIEQNRTIVAPVLLRPYKAWSNFWGSLTSDGFYARSFDYMDIINDETRGLWNVPYLSAAYLVNGTILRSKDKYPSYIYRLMDPDMAFCHNMRNKDVFMYVTNRYDFGHLVNADDFDITHLHNDLYEIFNNRWDWEMRYLISNYSDNLNDSIEVAQPCPDVYWFPIVSPRFCKELIETMENYGQWSSGTSHDPRLAGGYENVPTVDIHMNQVGLEAQWLEFLRLHVRPLQERVFTGYFHNPPRAIMNFVVRYKPDEQPDLKPHHDSSTYTINLGLNRPGIDYQGGGAHFLRYNCSVTNTRVGWLLMHPGRLTHYHQGLATTQGTRYIMISFVDP